MGRISAQCHVYLFFIFTRLLISNNSVLPEIGTRLNEGERQEERRAKMQLRVSISPEVFQRRAINLATQMKCSYSSPQMLHLGVILLDYKGVRAFA